MEAKNINETLNGLPLATLGEIAQTLQANPAQALARFSTRTEWTGGMGAKSTIREWSLGGETKARRFEFAADEPPELLGRGEAPNPQELLLGAVASCMSVTYAVTAAAMGIALTSLAIEMEGTLDLRGPMGLSDEIARGFPSVQCKVHIDADADEAMLNELHAAVLRQSANVEHLTKAVPLEAELVVRGG